MVRHVHRVFYCGMHGGMALVVQFNPGIIKIPAEEQGLSRKKRE